MHSTVTPASYGAWTRRRASLGRLDRALGIFTEVRAGEGVTALLLMLNIFLSLAAHYLLKTIREPLILSVAGGAGLKSYAATAPAGVLLLLLPPLRPPAARR